MSILSNLFGRRPSASLDSVTFDACRYQLQGDRDGARVWFLPEGGGVGLYFFPCPPDLPERAATIRQLQDFYATQLGTNSSVIDCRLLRSAGIPTVWLITKSRNDQTRGSIYLGALTIPFRDFSFVIKIQCQEQGTTGMREALLVAEALQKGTGRVEGDRFVPNGWSFDDEQFDEKLPKHPLSRVRRELRHIASTMQIDSKVKEAARFDLPENS